MIANIGIVFANFGLAKVPYDNDFDGFSGDAGELSRLEFYRAEFLHADLGKSLADLMPVHAVELQRCSRVGVVIARGVPAGGPSAAGVGGLGGPGSLRFVVNRGALRCGLP